MKEKWPLRLCVPLGSGAKMGLVQMNHPAPGLSQHREPMVVENTAAFPVKISDLISGFVV